MTATTAPARKAPRPVLVVFAKGTLRGNPSLWLRPVIDRRGHVTSRWKRLYDKPTPSIPLSTVANIQRGKAAMAHVILHQETARSAMHRTDLGWIDFVWGSAGKPPGPSGKRKGAKGIAHLLEARQRKDGLTLAQAQDLAMKMPEVIARGAQDRGLGKHATNIRIAYAGYIAVLVANPQTGHWLLTGWKKSTVEHP